MEMSKTVLSVNKQILKLLISDFFAVSLSVKWLCYCISSFDFAQFQSLSEFLSCNSLWGCRRQHLHIFHQSVLSSAEYSVISVKILWNCPLHLLRKHVVKSRSNHLKFLKDILISKHPVRWVGSNLVLL